MRFLDNAFAFIHRIKQRYAAAKDYPFANFPSGRLVSDENREIADSWSAVTGRTQQLVRDFPPFASATNNLVAYRAGSGFRFQSMAKLPDGSPDRVGARAIEEAFSAWSQSCDSAGVMSFPEMQQLWVRQQLESGDSLFQKIVTPEGRLKLRALSASNLSSGLAKTKNPVFMGIEYDRDTMARINYWFSPVNPVDDMGGMMSTEPVAIPAERILHGFDSRSPDQMRGISPFASAILLCSMVRDFMQAELATQQIHSKFTAFVTTPSVGPGGQWNKADADALMKGYSEQIKYGTMEFLRPGQTVTLSNTQRSAGAVKDFIEIVLRMVGATTGCPYQLVAENYIGLNYTVTRSSMNSFKQRLKVSHSSMETRLLRPVFEEWLDMEVMSGRLSLPHYYSRRESYLRHRWIAPGMESVDPMKDVKAAQLAVKSGFMSPQEFIMESGRDPDMVIDELREWKQQLKDQGMEELWNQALELDNIMSEDNPDDNGDDNAAKKPKAE